MWKPNMYKWSGNKTIKTCKSTKFSRTVQTSSISLICRGLFYNFSFYWPRSALLSPCQECMFTHWNIMFSSALGLVHTSDITIRTRSIRKQSMKSPLGLAKIKQEFFFVLSFVLFLTYAWTMILRLRLRRSLCLRLDLIPCCSLPEHVLSLTPTSNSLAQKYIHFIQSTFINASVTFN